MSNGSVVVVDAWAALAFLQKEETAELVVRRYIKRAKNDNVQLIMNIINLGEVYYRMIQVCGENKANERLYLFRQLPISLISPKEPMVMEAARIKAHYALSYADAFAVATARIENAALLTGDPEIVALPRSIIRTIRLDRTATKK